jgi:hypothetical protein
MSNEIKASTDWIGVATLLVVVSFLSGLSIISWQAYGYLRHEVWQPISVIDALRYANMKWAALPTDWLGLYRILVWIPLSMLLPITGIFLAFIVGMQDESV